jgi:predicted O-methyltransferase YrrM
MASEPLIGAMLRMLVASKPCGRFLELGTGTGIATAWLLEGMDERSTLISVDNDGAVQAVARDSLGADNRLTLVTAGGLDFLRGEPVESFDLVFGDAMPGKYEGLDHALAVVKVGGFYVIDDVLRQPNWPEGHADKVPILIEQLMANPEFEVLPLVWASGVVVAVRKHSEALSCIDAEKQQLLARLDDGLNALAIAVDGVGQDEAQSKLKPDDWSILECLEHLALSEEYLLSRLGNAGVAVVTIDPARAARILASGADRRHRFESRRLGGHMAASRTCKKPSRAFVKCAREHEAGLTRGKEICDR